ncbi:MAG: response regulator transcription factor [Peptococcaceae bacterium]|nr:response regulator transcription factor [Peptococcaceae bacterium]
MIRLAICDDDAQAVADHQTMAEKALRENGYAVSVTTYTQSENLLADVCDDGYVYDLILLDVEMPQLDGMTLVARLTPHLPQVLVIFITSHREYAIDAFALNIFRYVPKDELETRLPQALCDAAKRISLEDGKCYTIQTVSRLEKLPLKDILYIAREGKNVCFITTHGASLERTSLAQVMEQLDDAAFIYIDRGMIVNLVHLLEIKDGFAVLDSGQRLPISRGHLADVKARVATYWGALL